MALFSHLTYLLALSLAAALVGAKPAPAPEPALISDLVAGVQTLVGNIGNAPPPKLFWTPTPSPQCAAINQGQLQCCRGALAGDQPLVVFLAGIYGYKLNPNDVNGIICEYDLMAAGGGGLYGPYSLGLRAHEGYFM
ncbi:hypothetical protein TruAng_007507 [Truncatella angustata]|nr:hypothetical protein TruAng_007507 [Truncatella angustata]